jgi:hypothetical protein
MPTPGTCISSWQQRATGGQIVHREDAVIEAKATSPAVDYICPFRMRLPQDHGAAFALVEPCCTPCTSQAGVLLPLCVHYVDLDAGQGNMCADVLAIRHLERQPRQERRFCPPDSDALRLSSSYQFCDQYVEHVGIRSLMTVSGRTHCRCCG